MTLLALIGQPQQTFYTRGAVSGLALSPYLQAVEEIVGEDEPGAPDAQHTQHVPPQRLLRHAAVHRPVRLLLASRNTFITSSANCPFTPQPPGMHASVKPGMT